MIFSSSPPPVVHLIAKKLKKASGLKWVADFRDPWTDIHYYEDQTRLKLAANLDARMEASVLNAADRITCISRLDIELDFSRKIEAGKCITIPNGYDEEDFQRSEKAGAGKGCLTLCIWGRSGGSAFRIFYSKLSAVLPMRKKFIPATFS